MALKFYHMLPGPFAERCLFVLRLKQLAFEEIILDPLREENRTPEFLRMNPRGTLPLLVDGDLVVRESQAIMFYLDKAYPGPRLYGETPAEGAAIQQAICDQASYLEPLLKRVLGPLLFRKGAIDELAGVDRLLAAEIGLLEQTLLVQPFLAGASVSAADINIFPILAAARQCLGTVEAAGRAEEAYAKLTTLPAFSAWMARMTALDHRG